MENHRARFLIIDIDGVVKRGEEPVNGSEEAIDIIRGSGWRFVLATNNSTKTPQEVSVELSRMGINVGSEHVYTSALALTAALKRNLRLAAKASEGTYVIGEGGVITELLKMGFPVVNRMTEGLVVVGMDRWFSYEKLSVAMASLRGGALLVATNTDRTYPSGNTVLPGAGAMLAAVSACSGVRALVMGKPSTNYFRGALQVMGVDDHSAMESVVVIGDRPETDIRMANKHGASSILVLTGVTGTSDLKKLKHVDRPETTCSNLLEAVRCLQ